MKKKLLIFLGIVSFASAGYAEITGLRTPPAGVNGNVQINRNGSFGADSTFTYSTATKTLSVSTISATNMVATSSITAQYFYGDGSHLSGIAGNGGRLVYYLKTINSDVSGSSQQVTTPQVTKTTATLSGIGTTAIAISTYTSEAGFPGLSFIPAGIYLLHVHAGNTGAGNGSIYGEFWEVSSAGASIGRIGTTNTSLQETGTYLTSTESEYILEFSAVNVYVLASTSSRLQLRVFGRFAGGTHSLQLYIGGTADSHIELPSNTVDATNFVPYSGATQNVALGVYGISAATGVFTSSVVATNYFASSTTAGKPMYSFSSSTGTGWGLVSQSSPTLYVNGTPFMSAGLGNIFQSTAPHVWIGGGPLTGGFQPQPSEILTVYGEGGFPSSTYIDILSYNTGVNGARLVAYGGGPAGRHAVGIIGATGSNNPTFSWSGSPAFTHSSFIDFQTHGSGLFNISGQDSGSNSMWFVNESTNAVWNFGNFSSAHVMAQALSFSTSSFNIYPNQLALNYTGAARTILSAPSTGNTRTYTIPDVGGNSNFVLDNGTVTMTGTFSAKGTSTNDSAAVGYIGQYVESVVASSAMASGVMQDVTSISLTAGDWDVTYLAAFNPSSGSIAVTILDIGISVTAGNLTTGLAQGNNRLAIGANVSAANEFFGGCIPCYRMSLATTTTVYAKAATTWVTGNLTASCRLSARRVR